MNKIYRLAIGQILSNPAPQRIPRTGEKASEVDCYVMYIKAKDNSWDILADSIDDNGVNGRQWGQDGYAEELHVTFEDIDKANFEITHFYKTFDIQFSSLFDYILKGFFPYYQLSIQFNKAAQIFYNRRELTRTERMTTLQLILEKTIDKKNYCIAAYDLTSLLHSQRWYYHPDRNRNLNYNELLLDSLVASGDLEKVNNAYKLSSHALVSLSQHEQDERKHKETLGQSKAMTKLTFALILVGFAQVYVSYFKG
ncbi:MULTISPECIES: hypothetical protein [Vibrio]|uniref:hypothetical protein n=1 Tax=Vibrio TaxID=662 RepID=UPI00030F20D1|nr:MULTISPECIES: hypothetical protein [Vibrio]MCC4790377.1 hypothetical protein [Vibrio splendidus]OEF68267.1 hypothetical protein A152_20100 [Vibrio tasmaniensis 1F-187]